MEITRNRRAIHGLFVCLFVCSGMLFGKQASAYILGPNIVPENPTTKDFIHVEIEAGGCHTIYSDDIQIEGNIIKLTMDMADYTNIYCAHDPIALNLPLGQLPAGSYELEFYARFEKGFGFEDLELVSITPFNVQNVVGVPVNDWLTLTLLIVGFSWLAMHNRFSMR